MSTRCGPLVLIEPQAHLGGGHHQRTLTALAAARPGAVVITPQGIANRPGPLLRAAPASPPDRWVRRRRPCWPRHARRNAFQPLASGPSAHGAGRYRSAGCRTRSPWSPAV